MVFYLFIWSFLFIFERASEQAGEGQRERETQNPKQAPGSELSAEADTGLEPMSPEIITWAEVTRLADWANEVPHGYVF